MHFAEIDPETNIVKRVIVADAREWCEEHLGGVWKRTYYSTPGKTYAGISYEYVPDADNFRPPQPFPSWIFDFVEWQWMPPVPYPEDDGGVPRVWNEDTQTWVLMV
jgi:hypothetical protein